MLVQCLYNSLSRHSNISKLDCHGQKHKRDIKYQYLKYMRFLSVLCLLEKHARIYYRVRVYTQHAEFSTLLIRPMLSELSSRDIGR